MDIDDLISRLEEKMSQAQRGPFFVSGPDCACNSQTLNTDYIKEGESTYAEGQSYTISNEFGASGWETDSGYPGYGLTKANAEFFVAAANDVPELIKCIRELKGIGGDRSSARKDWLRWLPTWAIRAIGQKPRPAVRFAHSAHSAQARRSNGSWQQREQV